MTHPIIIDNLLDKLRSTGQLLGGALQNSGRTPLGNTGFFCQNVARETQLSALAPDAQGIDALNPVPLVESELSSGRFTSRLHWLQGTFNYSDYYCLQIFVEKLESIFNDTFEWDCGPFTRGLRYQDSAKSFYGIILSWIRPTSFKPGYAWISIPGSSLDRLLNQEGDPTLICLLFHLLTTGIPGSNDDHKILWGWKTTRLDTALDDFEKKIRPIDLLAIAKEGNFSGFRHQPIVCSRSPKWIPPSYSSQSSLSCDANGNVLEATTVYFGSPESDKRLYIYDKFLESEGAIDSVRWEARWSDDYAHERFNKICTCFFDSSDFTSFPNLIASMTLGAIDFIDRSSADRVSRCKRLPFWQEFVDYLGRVKVAVPPVFQTIERTVEWIEHQVETSFAILEKVAGFENFINGILRLRDRGFDRLSKEHHKIINQAINDGYDLHNHLDQIFANKDKVSAMKLNV